LRAIIDKRERFWIGAAFLNRRTLSLCTPGVAGRSKTRPCGRHHLGERFEGLRFCWNGSLASGNVGLAVGVRIVRQRRMRGVQHHALGPFMIGMDPDVDLLIERNVRLRINRCREAPVCGEECREKKASYPPEIL
jgi:hypothetical protein